MRNLLVALALGLAACGASPSGESSTGGSADTGGENTMTEAQFAQVQQGMTAEDVRAITGGLCDEKSTPAPGAEPTVTITCTNANGSAGTVVVERGHVTQATKAGTLP